MKSVIITGGSRGIGAAAVRLFSSKGWDVYFLYKKSDSAAELTARETGACALRADVSDMSQVKNAVERFREFHRCPDALINNAAICSHGLLQDTDESQWERMFAVNVTGMYNCIHELLPEMIKRGSGSIINVSSIWGITGASCEVPYSASKAAVIGLTKALAKETGPSGIRVNCVAPGVIDTEMNANLTEDDRALIEQDTPLGRIGTAEEIAQLMYYLCSDDASFITGQVISPNGGFVI